MKRQFLLPALAAATIAFFLNSCASLTGYQDGRSVGKNNGEISASVNVNQSPEFNNFNDQQDTFDIVPSAFPNIEIGGRYGVAEKFDIGMRINSNLNISLNAKYQLVGDRQSPFALAIGAEAGTFSLGIGGLWNVQVPVFASIHPSEKFAVYLNPRYIYQFSSWVGAEDGVSYAGGNTGLLFGNRNKFGVDFGFYSFGTSQDRTPLLQFGIGGRFALGRN